MAKLMRRAQTTQTLKLRLLALVLALALVWYSLNPTPRVVIRRKPKAEPSDEKEQNTEPRTMPGTFSIAGKMAEVMATPLPPQSESGDDFEWPEYIDG
jgi:hypothetical protein